ncbi:DNA-binding transcriptional LysR family regulator [Rhizobium sp. BK313]|uniref:LysR family transcriptional regulator n=1 Tax=Rhizobium sp. BK313 TaxID=2587081 RepID=UPI0010EFBC23|nr:LysR family transcriptional regulator [Rhizobium sp. BK313]MBB3455149.1 DNA-binding transcriptional LysR family regulator [Rhizobium sp. BK313]
MELRTLRAFVEVVRQGGFSEAAKVVFTTQSAVSKAVRQLEDELGLPLLNRIGHRTTLTDAGEVVYRRALTILAGRDDLIAELAELRGLSRGMLRLGLPPIGNDALFAPLFAVFRSRYPGIEIKLVEQGAKRLEEMVLSGEVDLGASLLPAPEVFEWQSVRREPMHVLLPAGHTLEGQKTVRLAGLKDNPFILFESGFALNGIILDACRTAGFEPDIVARSSQINFIIELVAAGLGVGFLPRMIAEQRDRAGVSHALVAEPSMEWHMAWIWRRGGYLTHAVRAWLDLAGKQSPKS